MFIFEKKRNDIEQAIHSKADASSQDYTVIRKADTEPE